MLNFLAFSSFSAFSTRAFWAALSSWNFLPPPSKKKQMSGTKSSGAGGFHGLCKNRSKSLALNPKPKR